jgi:aryl-alcohol dehydrogenase-like predicted oxidoreductase
LPLNVFDQRFVHDGTLRRLHAAGIEIHARSALLQGLLLMPTAALPPYFSSLKPHHEAYLAGLTRAGLSPLTGALGYFHSRPEVAIVLVGVENCLQLQDCLVATRDAPAFDFASFSVDDPHMLDPRFWR